MYVATAYRPNVRLSRTACSGKRQWWSPSARLTRQIARQGWNSYCPSLARSRYSKPLSWPTCSTVRSRQLANISPISIRKEWACMKILDNLVGIATRLSQLILPKYQARGLRIHGTVFLPTTSLIDVRTGSIWVDLSVEGDGPCLALADLTPSSKLWRHRCEVTQRFPISTD